MQGQPHQILPNLHYGRAALLSRDALPDHRQRILLFCPPSHDPRPIAL
ncbi:hypothetical protein KNP414_04706 [Paenibacillus mucilaginosus KNP414]|uniref:Uncharacterized protein n=1 Tax=Paenibacillus mucilaginosus (strain KNP414) TaxID=1036673 RepID=F8FFX4_PAEMK|nr:hypothetical protein KNP414_04706 [Paenibacillus mucilaginosus KNP414]